MPLAEYLASEQAREDVREALGRGGDREANSVNLGRFLIGALKILERQS